MKELILIFLCLIVLSCKKKSSTNNTVNSTNSAQTPPPAAQDGTLTISIMHPQRACEPQPYAVKHTVGLGYSSTDIANDAFFAEKPGYKSGTSYSFKLKPGLYYYKGKACCTNCNTQICNGFAGFTGVGTCKEKSGSIEVSSGQSYSRSINLN